MSEKFMFWHYGINSGNILNRTMLHTLAKLLCQSHENYWLQERFLVKSTGAAAEENQSFLQLYILQTNSKISGFPLLVLSQFPMPPIPKFHMMSSKSSCLIILFPKLFYTPKLLYTKLLLPQYSSFQVSKRKKPTGLK